MDFIKVLEETYRGRNFRDLKHIPIPHHEGFSLSIQASYAHRCTPKQTLPLDDYLCMEFAIVGHGMLCNLYGFITNDDLRIQLDEYFNGSTYSYVPIELIEELYKELILEGDSDGR